MSKTPSDKLFRLIHSLSGSELRYVSIYLKRQATRSDQKYLLLFQTIAAQATQDETALQKKVYGDEKITSRKYSQLKAYLYQALLNALQLYDEGSSIVYKINNLLQKVRVLYNRSHYRECLELLTKGKKIGEEYELFLELVEVLDWRKKIAYARENIAFLDAELQNIDKEEQSHVEQIRNLSVYQRILYELIISRRKYAVLRSADQQQWLAEILAHPLLESPEKALSIRARILYFRIRSNAAYSMLKYDDFYSYSQSQIDLMEEYPMLLREDKSAYIYGMTNLIQACGLLKKYDEVKYNLLKFKELKGVSKDDDFRIFKHYNALTFRLCIQTGAFEEGWKVFQEHLKDLPRYEGQSLERGSFYFQYFYISFGKGTYDEALKYLNLWLNLPRSIEREDLQSLARMLNLIIHYEMGNIVLLESLIKNTYRYLRRKNQVYEFEKTLLQFFQQAVKGNDRTRLSNAWKELKIAIEELAEQPSEKILLEYFDFTSWIESKINKIPFATVVANRYQRAK